jgi:hypothetical protein
MACSTRVRVAGFTCCASLITRETVTGDTPAILATSFIVGIARVSLYALGLKGMMRWHELAHHLRFKRLLWG